MRSKRRNRKRKRNLIERDIDYEHESQNESEIQPQPKRNIPFNQRDKRRLWNSHHPTNGSASFVSSGFSFLQDALFWELGFTKRIEPL